MTLTALPFPNYSGADLSARVNATVTEVRAARAFASVAALRADTTLAYGTGARPVAAGDRVAAAEGHAYDVAASAASDHHLTTAGGVKLYVLPGPRGWNVRAFGAKGDGATDDTAAFAAAKAAAVAAGGGTLYAPGGTYVLHEFALTNGTSPAQATAALEGDYGATIIRARDAGRFAITLFKNGYSQFWWGPLIRNVEFNGRVGGTSRMGCGLYAPRETRLEHVSFTECLIGYATGCAFYFGGRMLNFRDCYLGAIQGTYVGNLAIADLVNGAGQTVAVTLPFAMQDGNGHGGNRGFDSVRISQCDIGWAILGETYSPHNDFTKFTAEYCQIGLLVINGSVALAEPWFESNATSGTITLNGTTYEKGAVVTGSKAANSTFQSGFGGRATLTGGRVDRLVARDGGMIEVDDWCLMAVAPTELAGGRVLCDRALGDNIRLPLLVRRPGVINPNGNSVLCLAVDKTDPTPGLKVRGGNLLAAEDFTGAALVTTKISFHAAAGYAVPVFGQAGGVFPAQKFARATGDLFGINLLISPDLVPGAAYALVLRLRSSQALSFSAVNASGFLVNPGTFAHPLNEWFTLGLLVRNQTTTGTPRLVLTPGAAGTVLDFGGLQLARFANRLDAAEFMADTRFYMTEG